MNPSRHFDLPLQTIALFKNISRAKKGRLLVSHEQDAKKRFAPCPFTGFRIAATQRKWCVRRLESLSHPLQYEEEQYGRKFCQCIAFFDGVALYVRLKGARHLVTFWTTYILWKLRTYFGQHSLPGKSNIKIIFSNTVASH